MYDSLGDASMRLEMSIVCLNGFPIYIEKVHGSDDCIALKCYELTGKKQQITVLLDSPHLSLSSPRLGYVQIGSNAYYVTRCPKRKQRQGIDASQVYFYENGNNEPYRGMSFQDVGRAVEGPPKTNINKALIYLKKGVEEDCSFALTRDLAISFKGLFYHAKKIGNIVVKPDVIEIHLTKKEFNTYPFKEELNENFRIIAAY